MTQQVQVVSPAGRSANYLRPVRRALVMDDDVYSAVAFGPSPLTRGFLVLLAILGVVVVAKILGWLFALLVMPRLGWLQANLQEFIVGLRWYANQAAQSPGFEQQFQQTYNLIWEGLRTLFGQPTVTSLIGSTLSFIIMTLGAWLSYSLLAQLLARWFGGEATFGQLAGALAISYAPLVILVIEIWPGATVPITLMFLLLFIFKYLAIRRTHGLAPITTLAITVGPYVIALVALLFISLFALALGLDRIPVIGDLLRVGGRLPAITF